MSGSRKSRIRQSNLAFAQGFQSFRAGSRRGNFHVLVIEQFDDALTLDLVVFDDQQAALARLRVLHDPVESFLQFVGGGRLDQI